MTEKNALIVIGANGFIGRNLIAESIKNNFLTIAFIRKKSKINIIENKGIHYFYYDLNNKNSIGVSKVVKSLKILDYNITIVNTAGPAHKKYKKIKYIYGITKLTKSLAKEALDINANFINISSLAARNYRLQIKDNLYNYGKQKLISEKIINKMFYNSSKKLSVISLRPPAIWGSEAKGSFHLLNKIIDLNLPLPISSIQNKRPYLHINNLTKCIIDISIKLKVSEYEPFRVMDINDGEYTLDEIMKVICKENSKKIKTFYFPEIIIKCFLYIFKKSLYNQIFFKLKSNNEQLNKFLK